MKIKRGKNEQGNAIIVALLLSVTGGIFLGSYLKLSSNSVLASARSLAWNQALIVAETGVDQALNDVSSIELPGLTTIGWTLSGSQYSKTNSVDSGMDYEVTISGTTNAPVIVSRGYYPFYKAPSGKIARAVQVTAVKRSLLNYSVLTKKGANANGNKIKFDSFDSRDPAYSTGGMYDPSKFKANGGIATNDDAEDTLGIGNAEIWGTVSTGPGGTASMARNGSVGSAAWVSGGSSGIESGAFTDDMNVAIPDVVLPTMGNPFPPLAGPLPILPLYTYYVAGGDYTMSSLNLKSSEEMYINSPARIYVEGAVDIKGKITVATGASLELYVKGPSMKIGGQGIVNDPGTAESVIVKGLSTLTSIAFSGNFEFIGVVYAPYADVTFNGGGSDEIDMMGAMVVNSMTANGKINFHYDEALEDLDEIGGYVVDSWVEL